MKHYYLITTFNNAEYIEAAFESIRQQYVTLGEFYDQARVLIVDDFSSDGTSAKVSELARKFRNTQSFRNETNRGAGFSRNVLLNWMMSGNIGPDDVVMFVDGDDLLPKDCLKIKLEELAADPSLECIGGQIEVINSQGKTTGYMNTFVSDPRMEEIAALFECHFYISNALFRARVFRRPSVRFPSTRVSEDWLFFAMHPIKRRHTDAVTLRYRRHSTNLTTTHHRDTGEAYSARWAVRTIGMLSLGLLHDKREHQLMDMVGYLAFQLRWRGHESVMDTQIDMPWFVHLKTIPEVESNWPAVRQEIVALFDRISSANRRINRFDQPRLDAFLSAMLDAADQTVRGGRLVLSIAPQSGAGATAISSRPETV